MVFNFFANDGRSARLNMCITKRDGSDSFARGIVDAVMTVLRKRSISSTLGVIKYSNGNSQDVERFHDLEGKKIGVILQRVNDPSDEKYPFHMELLTPFDADDPHERPGNSREGSGSKGSGRPAEDSVGPHA